MTPSRNSLRVLVVEDMADARECLEVLLRGEGWEVVCAASGVDALVAAANASFDVVLLDHCMPGMDGAAFLKALRELPGWASIPVILATGIAPDHADRIVAGCSAPITVLRKPYDPALLLEHLKGIAADRDEGPPGYPPGMVGI